MAYLFTPMYVRGGSEVIRSSFTMTPSETARLAPSVFDLVIQDQSKEFDGAERDLDDVMPIVELLVVVRAASFQYSTFLSFSTSAEFFQSMKSGLLVLL